MKQTFTLILILSIIGFATLSTAQQIIVTDDASYTTPASGSMLDVKSTSKGFMPPRVALTGTNVSSPVTSPSLGLLVYNTATTNLGTVYDVTPGYYYNAGTDVNPNWVQVVNSTGVGTAAVWDDLRVPLSEPSTGVTKPDWQKFPFGETANAPFINWFRATGIDEMYFVVQLPHDWREGTVIYPHIHWTPSVAGAAGPTVPKWDLQYTWANLGEVYPAYVTISGSTTTNSEVLVASKTYITALGGGIDGSGKRISSMLICRIYRDGDHTSDTFAGLAGALEIDFHYEKSSMGSRLQYIK
ncbi:MAG: hypothetical protein ACOYLO_18350 [Ferruginibacter sp.]